MAKPKLWRTVLIIAAAAVGGWLFLWFLGPVLLPFAFGLLLAKLAEPAVSALQKRSGFPRWVCTGLCIAILYALLSALLWLICRILCRELVSFGRALPELLQSLSEPAQTLERRLLLLSHRFPDGIGQAIREGVAEFFRSGAGLSRKLYDWVFGAASAVLRKIPTIALFLLTAVLSSFMFSAQLPKLTHLWNRKAPESWKRRFNLVTVHLQQTMGGWFKAQLKLMLITFLLLTGGFLLLGINYPLLLGVLIALIDALPVFGVGIVLIPWSLLQFLQGQSVLGTGLLCLYGVAVLLRTALEPRLLGKQIGLDPLLTLFSLYAGHHFLGIAGMILFPVAAILLVQFWRHMEKKIDI